MKKIGSSFEITTREKECFSAAIEFIMLNDEKWKLLSTEVKSELINKAHTDFLENPFEEINGCQAFANALYWLLKNIGHDEGLSEKWAEVLRHAVVDETPTRVQINPPYSLEF